MTGILLTLLAVLLVICLAFCHTDHSRASRDSAGDFPYPDKINKGRG